MKRLCVIAMLIFSLFLTGCYSYNDINRMLFPTAIVIDIDEAGNPVVALEIFHAFRSHQENAEQGQRIIYIESGRTLLDVINSFELIAAHPLSYTQNRVIIFTEKAVEAGIGEYLDYFRRKQEFLLRPYVAVYYGEIEDLMKVEIKQNEYIGLYIFDLFDRPLARATMNHKKLYEVLRERHQGKNTYILTALTLDKSNLATKITKDGAAVLHNDQLEGKLELEEMQPLGFLINTIRIGYLDVPQPHYEDKFFTLQILNNSTISDIVYEDGKIVLKKTMELRTTLVGTEESLILDEETISAITTNAESVIKKNCHKLFNKYKDQGLDIFFVQEMFHRKYPGIEVENAIEVTQLEIQVNHHLEGSTDFSNYR